MNSDTQIAPSAWASYLINGDASGISAEEKERADNFIADLGFGMPVSCEDFGYSKFLRCDAQVYTFLQPTGHDVLDRARAFYRSLQRDVAAGTRSQGDAEQSAIRRLTDIGWDYDCARREVLK